MNRFLIDFPAANAPFAPTMTAAARGAARWLALAGVALAFSAAPVCAAPTSAVGGMDIGALMARAEDTLDLRMTDAVLLFDGRDVDIAQDGAVTTTFHQIVWISTELGIDEYADLRVPWNTSNAELEVVALRTWMDGRWWPHESNLNPTAIVETTPYAVASADDYTTMRETMLLHDGVELPCIMETVHRITRRMPEGVASDGLWVFERDDPAVVVSRSVTVAPDVPLAYAVGGGAPEPEVAGSGSGHRYLWVMRDQPRLGVPHVADATAHAPYACWSTWSGWNALGSALDSSITTAGGLTDALRDTVAALTEREAHVPARVEAVASFVAGATRSIGYDTVHWAFEPRAAVRTYETAYGHRLDRAVLAAALLREVEGVSRVVPFYSTAGLANVATDVPGTSRFGAMELFVDGPRVRGVYDPASSSFRENAPDPFDGRTVWRVGQGAPSALTASGLRDPVFAASSGDVPARFASSVTLARDDEGEWSGSGVVEGSGALSFHGRVAGIGSETERFCRSVAGDAVGGADVTSSNVASLLPERSVAGFGFDWDPGDPDERDRSVLTFGLAAGGIESRLPAGVHLYEVRRSSPVILVAPFEETLTLRVKLPEDDLVLVPDDYDVENAVGRATQTVERDGDWLTVHRSLTLASTTIRSERWPELRALLLAGESAQTSTIMFE